MYAYKPIVTSNKKGIIRYRTFGYGYVMFTKQRPYANEPSTVTSDFVIIVPRIVTTLNKEIRSSRVLNRLYLIKVVKPIHIPSNPARVE